MIVCIHQQLQVGLMLKAAVWSLEKKVDLARKFECSVHEQACNDGNRGSQMTKMSH